MGHHLSVHKGKMVVLHFRGPRKPEIDRFLRKSDDHHYLYFERLGKVRAKELRGIAICKGGLTSSLRSGTV